MKEDYLQYLLDFETLCLTFKEIVIDYYFTDSTGSKRDKVDTSDTYFCFTPKYQQLFKIIKGIVEICDIFGIKNFEKCKNEITNNVVLLEEPQNIQDGNAFEYYIDTIIGYFRSEKKEIEDKITPLKAHEIARLNEAIHCFLEGCYYSSVAMSVSAIESKLFSLMMSTCYDPKLKELTLGQLIREYLDDKQKYGNVIPKKHETLLDHCNTYRIFSVHPKKEEINKSIANSILNMTFLFLLDKKLVEKVKEAEAI